MGTPEILKAARAAYELAAVVARLNPTPENRDAKIAAWNALTAVAVVLEPVKRAGYASRAGKRQAAARRGGL